MATNPYTSQAVPATYNASPPADDGSQVADNVTSWTSHVIGKVGTPLKTFVENVNTAITAAFAKTINTDADENNVIAGSLAFTASTLTLATGAATGTRAHHVIAAESGTSDDFDTLTATNYSAGEIVYLRADTGDAISVTTAGNFSTTFALSEFEAVAVMLVGSTWYPLNRPIVFRDVSAATVSNTASETTVYTVSIPQGLLGADRMLRFTLWGEYLNSSGSARNLSVQVKLGATTLLVLDPSSIGADATTRGVILLGHVASLTTASQMCHGELKIASDITSSADEGIDTLAKNRMALNNSATEDTKGDLTFLISVTHSSASANLTFVARSVIVELV